MPALGAYEGSADGLIPRRNRVAMGTGLCGTFAVVMARLTPWPHVGPFVETLRPSLGDWFSTNRASLRQIAPFG